MVIKKRYDIKLIKTQLNCLRGLLFGSKNAIFKAVKNSLAEKLVVERPKPKRSSNNRFRGTQRTFTTLHRSKPLRDVAMPAFEAVEDKSE